MDMRKRTRGQAPQVVRSSYLMSLCEFRPRVDERQSVRTQAIARHANTRMKMAAETLMPRWSYMMGAVIPPNKLLSRKKRLTERLLTSQAVDKPCGDREGDDRGDQCVGSRVACSSRVSPGATRGRQSAPSTPLPPMTGKVRAPDPRTCAAAFCLTHVAAVADAVDAQRLF